MDSYKYIPLFKVNMSPGAIDMSSETLASGYIGQGPKVELFEDLLHKELRREVRPLTLNSCTSALDLSLHLCGVEPGDEVISTALTCFATNSPIINRRARIRWADVDPYTGCMDPETVEKLITPKTKAIMAVDWAGRICDYEALKQFGIPVIQDAAHVWVNESYHDSLEDGGVEFGDYTCFSLQAIKFLTSVDGGILIPPADKYKEAKLLRWYGLDRDAGYSFRCAQNIQVAGYKYHMNDVSAAIGIANMQRAREAVLDHQVNANLTYHQVTHFSPNLSAPPRSEGYNAHWILPVLVEKGTTEDFIKHMKEHNIEASPVHYRNDLYEATKEFKEGPLPGLEHYTSKQVSVPNGWWLSGGWSDHKKGNELTEHSDLPRIWRALHAY